MINDDESFMDLFNMYMLILLKYILPIFKIGIFS